MSIHIPSSQQFIEDAYPVRKLPEPKDHVPAQTPDPDDVFRPDPPHPDDKKDWEDIGKVDRRVKRHYRMDCFEIGHFVPGGIE